MNITLHYILLLFVLVEEMERFVDYLLNETPGIHD